MSAGAASRLRTDLGKGGTEMLVAGLGGAHHGINPKGLAAEQKATREIWILITIQHLVDSDNHVEYFAS